MDASTKEGLVREVAEKTKKTAGETLSTPLHAAKAEDGFPMRPDEPAPGAADEPSLSEADAAREQKEKTVEHTIPEEPDGDFA
ncbi:hypothetical protein BSFA1_85690 (plasmid) [Burkholderia sp. SFA1]|nr:hypothetical protein BSFA1_85690 [Burkholderia sp. SFA1]